MNETIPPNNVLNLEDLVTITTIFQIYKDYI